MSEQKPKNDAWRQCQLCGSGQSITSNAMGMRAMQQPRLAVSWRAVSAAQVATGFGQESSADVRGARQAASPKPEAGDCGRT